MQSLFEIRSDSGSHPVRLATAALREAVEGTRPDLILADRIFRDALAGIEVPVVFLEAAESSKDIANMAAILEGGRKHGLTRSGHLVAIGGGTIQDIAGFVASIYMRGCPWTYFPTTLLGMVDSCIGGKSSINVGDFKNLVGTFYPPRAVVIATSVLQTLTPEHVVAGRVEAAKICFARGPEAFARYLEIDAGAADPDYDALVAHSLACKKWFVEIDEFDRNERLLLNFGHSFGHAIESCSGYRIPHGIAVGIGCLAAVRFSAGEHPASMDWPLAVQLDDHLRALLRTVATLPSDLATIDRADFLRYFDSDKKHDRDCYRPILLRPDAALYRAELPRGVDAAEAIWRAFDATRASLR